MQRARHPAAGALAADLAGALGATAVATDLSARRAASTDWSHLSPILSARRPAALADVVAYPRTPAEVATAVRLAYRHRVPVTCRGRGTGNYGQALPLRGGLVIETTRCDRVLEVGEGWARVEAGASFVAVEAAARRRGQELAIMPSTVGSTVGGFIAGGAGGIGSIEHGWIWEGYVRALEAVPCTEDAAPVTLTGEDCRPLVHAYGVSGVIVTATVALAPARDWTALLAAFPEEGAALAAARQLLHLEPPPRLVSLDEPGIVATYPPDPAMPPGQYSLRATIDRSVEQAARAAVAGHGGAVTAVRPRGAGYLASLAFNHVTYRARKARPELCHLQVGGSALVTRAEEARAVLPGALLHLDGFRVRPGPGGRGFVGLLLCPFPGTRELYAAVARLRALGIHVTDPHTWLLGGDLDGVRAAARRMDPEGLLNPGKLPPP